MTSSTPSSVAEQSGSIDDSVIFAPEFVKCLEKEAELLKNSIGDGISPMDAHARTIIWLDSLVKMHSIGLEQAIESKDTTQAAIWSRDLATLELAMALVQTVKPLES